MKKTEKIAWILGIALSWPFAVSADDLNYTYLQADLIADGEADFSGGGFTGSDDYDGFELEGSIGSNQIFFLASFTQIEDSAGDELDLFSLGPGVNASLGPDSNADVFGALTFESIDIDDGGVEGDGFGLNAGIRWLPAPAIELKPQIAYVDYGELDNPNNVDMDGWRYSLSGIFNVSEQFALTAEYRTTDFELSGPGGTADLSLENEIHVGGRLYLVE